MNGQTIDYYDRHADSYARETFDLDMSDLYQPFLSRLAAHSRILDAGCGSGRDALKFTERGFIVTAMEPAAEMAAIAARHTGLEILQLRFQDLAFSNEFDGVWACASLLHVPRAELPEVFTRLSRAIKTGGILYASFKFGSDEYTEDGRYFNSFDQENFSNFLSGFGEFEPVEIWKTADVRGVASREWLNMLLRKLY